MGFLLFARSICKRNVKTLVIKKKIRNDPVNYPQGTISIQYRTSQGY